MEAIGITVAAIGGVLVLFLLIRWVLTSSSRKPGLLLQFIGSEKKPSPPFPYWDAPYWDISVKKFRLVYRHGGQMPGFSLGLDFGEGATVLKAEALGENKISFTMGESGRPDHQIQLNLPLFEGPWECEFKVEVADADMDAAPSWPLHPAGVPIRFMDKRQRALPTPVHFEEQVASTAPQNLS